MSISGILIATAIVGGVGLFIGLFLGGAAILFKVEVNEKKRLSLHSCPEITAAAADIPAVRGWLRP